MHWRTLLDDPAVQRRFWDKVNMTEDCWLWTAANDKGYGIFFVGVLDGQRITKRSHRVAWEMCDGPLTPGLVIDHLCRNPACVNLLHLEEVTTAENARRSPLLKAGMRNHYKRQEFCNKGLHRLDETAVPHCGNRICGECRKEWTRQWERARYAHRKAEAK